MKWFRKTTKPNQRLSLDSLPQLDNKQAWTEAKTSNSRFFIFKHSIRCSISSTALQRVLRYAEKAELPIYWVDVVNHRSLSLAIADETGVHHESPQLLLYNNGTVTGSQSHLSVNPEALLNS